ncbi:MAG: metallophosphoesterase [Christensenellales bacterium]
MKANIKEIHFENQFKVIQLCDTHLDGKTFESSLDEIDAMLKIIKPDLAVFTGDNVVLDLELDVYDVINALFLKHNVKWLLLLGNHDAEFTSTSRKEIIEKCSSLSHCVTANSENKGRYGDTIIRLFSNKQLVAEIVGFDSGDYQKVGFCKKYASILDEQVDWYKKNTISMAKFVYFHIPQKEFLDAFKNGKKEQYIHGLIREHMLPSGRKKPFVSPVSAGFKRSSFFNAANDGSLKAIFVGHDHLNDANILYKGVHLVYGQKTCRAGYNCVERGFSDNMGTTLLTINCDGSFEISPIEYGNLVLGEYE